MGCVDTPNAHCAYLEPKYLPDVCDVPASDARLSVAADTTIDPTEDVMCNGGVVPQTSGASLPDICVIHYGSIDVDATLRFTPVSGAGTVGRVVALVADNDLTIVGTLNVSALGLSSGPGGGYVQSGGTGTVQSGDGGGGAGYHTNGGAGGTATSDGGAGNGGTASLDPSALIPLYGGAKNSGGGGGAATLISCHGSVTVMGWLAANGGGGYGGIQLGGVFSPGGGGGAGGYVVLQGLNVDVKGQVYANGGGGGGGTYTGATARFDGRDGGYSDSIAATGGQPGNGAGAGGAGGVGLALPGDGTHPTGSGATPGGGGGSVGFFQSYTPAGVTPTLSPSHASPNFQPNGTVNTR
jgi:hypothetical protein